MSTKLSLLRFQLKDFQTRVNSVVSCMASIEGKTLELETLEVLVSALQERIGLLTYEIEALRQERRAFVPLEKAKTLKTERNSIPCPWGCGFVFKPHRGKYYDIRPLKLHLTKCCPDTPTTVGITPYAKKAKTIPVGTDHIEALIACGFKKLKDDPTMDWRRDFLRHKCNQCTFRHYNARKVKQGQHACTKYQYKNKRVTL